LVPIVAMLFRFNPYSLKHPILVPIFATIYPFGPPCQVLEMNEMWFI